MKSDFKLYSLLDSVKRINEILDAPAGNYEERDGIPSRDTLTYTNGFYVNCSCIFMDIVDSSSLPQLHQRPVLAKIYRAFISESVAIMNGSGLCSEVNIHGDAVWGVYDTTTRNGIDSVFNICAKLNSLIQIINCRLKKRKISEFRVGIGAAYGRALMIKAGYKGSGLNEVVWMGDVVNEAANCCKNAKGSFYGANVCVSQGFFGNLNDYNKSLLYNSGWYCCCGSIVDSSMNDWYKENCINKNENRY